MLDVFGDALGEWIGEARIEEFEAIDLEFWLLTQRERGSPALPTLLVHDVVERGAEHRDGDEFAAAKHIR